MKYIDLHTHTNASDGTYSPEELIDYAIKKKLSAIAITDHDTIKGVIKAKKYIKKIKPVNFELISGIEFSTNLTNFKKDIHILGLYIDETNTDFVESLESIINSRNIRNHKMIQKLNEIGIYITIEDVINNSTNGVITRAHFAKALLDKGYINNINEAFKKYIGNNCIAFVPRKKLEPKKAIEMILNCGGVPILAHPTLYELNSKEIEQLILELKTYGLQGIEGIYSLYTKQEEKCINDLALKYNLVISGGSDFHGDNKLNIDLGVGKGNLKIPYDLLVNIKQLINHNF